MSQSAATAQTQTPCIDPALIWELPKAPLKPLLLLQVTTFVPPGAAVTRLGKLTTTYLCLYCRCHPKLEKLTESRAVTKKILTPRPYCFIQDRF